MRVIIDEIVTEVIIEPDADELDGRGPDPAVLRELVLQVLRDELEWRDRRRDGDR